MKPIKLKTGLIFLLLLTLLSGTAWSKTTRPKEQITAPEVKYSHFSLKNGLEVYVFEDHQVPLVEVNLWYKVGSLDEPEGLTGISHLLEHTMFLGTDALAKDQVHKLVKQVGGINNAYTNYDQTVYYEKVPAANLELAIAIEADRMRNLKIDPQEFAREKEVVKQERRMRTENDVLPSSFETIKATAFTQSAFHHEIIGWMKDIDAITPAQLRDYYDHYYAPNNAILAVTGDATPVKVQKLVEAYFGEYQPATIKRNTVVEPEQNEERKITIEKLTHIPYIVMLYKLPAENNPDMLALDILLDILVNQPNSRLNLELKQKQELILGCGAGSSNLSVPGFAQIVLVPVSQEKIATVETAFEAELARLIQNGIRDEELEAIKKASIKNLVFQQRELNSLAGDVILGSLRYHDPRFYLDKINRFNAITPADLVRVAQQYLVKKHRTTGYVVPLKNTTEGSK